MNHTYDHFDMPSGRGEKFTITLHCKTCRWIGSFSESVQHQKDNKDHEIYYRGVKQAIPTCES